LPDECSRQRATRYSILRKRKEMEGRKMKYLLLFVDSQRKVV
jgi:hypothetical protein